MAPGPGSADIAIRKAKPANFFDMDSGDSGKMLQPGKPLYGIEVTHEGLVSFPGGALLKDSSKTIIGASGVSGTLRRRFL